MCAILLCICHHFQCGVLGQVRYLNVLIPDLCLLTYFCFELPKSNGVDRTALFANPVCLYRGPLIVVTIEACRLIYERVGA